MDPIRNPYSPGAGSRPPALVGREAEIDAFDIALQRMAIGRSAKSMLLTGLRGVGKTVLLDEFGLAASNSAWIHESLEANDEMDFPRAMGTLARKAALRVSVGQRAGERFRRALGVIKSFQVTWNIPDAGSVAVEPFAGISDSGVLDADLGELLIELGELASERGRGALFTIDEMQYLSKEHLAALVQGFHLLARRGLPVMLAGAGLPSLLGLIGEARSYAERLFDFPRIDSLPDDSAAAALERPAAEEDVVWRPDAVRRTVEVTGGYPYFLQEFGKQAWDVAPGPVITLRDVEDAVPVALAELDEGFFRVRIDRTSDGERQYLRAMAGLGPGPYGTGEVASSLDRTTRQMGMVRDSLIKRGLCYSPRWGEIEFTVPMFDDFVRRAMS
ncbi:MAG: ATP-binding protein [Acidimicrobiia bacterium]|nr:ATP-binding protein [Acidimicrobiia bacterium]